MYSEWVFGPKKAERARVMSHISPHIAIPLVSCRNHSNNWHCLICATIESFSLIAFLIETNRSFRIGAMKMTFYRTAFFEKVCLISHQTDLLILSRRDGRWSLCIPHAEPSSPISIYLGSSRLSLWWNWAATRSMTHSKSMWDFLRKSTLMTLPRVQNTVSFNPLKRNPHSSDALGIITLYQDDAERNR